MFSSTIVKANPKANTKAVLPPSSAKTMYMCAYACANVCIASIARGVFIIGAQIVINAGTGGWGLRAYLHMQAWI